MNTAITQTYQVGGYQGYLFLRHLFCVDDCQMVNLDFITLLFPNVKYIFVTAMSTISSQCLDHILKYLSTINSRCASLRAIALSTIGEWMIWLHYTNQNFKLQDGIFMEIINLIIIP
eukprot:511438_1